MSYDGGASDIFDGRNSVCKESISNVCPKNSSPSDPQKIYYREFNDSSKTIVPHEDVGESNVPSLSSPVLEILPTNS